jgi:toxin ParE1/3/4
LDIWDYIAEENHPAAADTDELFSNAVFALADFPDMGKLGKIIGTRELSLTKTIA